MSDYYGYHPLVELVQPIVVTGHLADFTRTATYRAASHLGLAYHDIDRLVEHEAAMEIARLVWEQGETAYRELESRCLVRALREQPAGLIALGDGGLLLPDNRARVKEEGQLIVFDFDLANLFWRIQKLARQLEPAAWHPLFAGPPEDLAEIKPFFQDRKAAFDGAWTAIDANALSPVEACQALMDRLQASRRAADHE